MERDFEKEMTTYYAPCGYAHPKEDLGLPCVFSRFEWERMSYYMRWWWNRGGRPIGFHWVWNLEEEQAAEDARERAWLSERQVAMIVRWDGDLRTLKKYCAAVNATKDWIF